MSKAVVLLSGGQDSTTALYWAKMHFDVVEAISVHYGQRHHTELDAAACIAHNAMVKHKVLRAPVLADLADSALTGSQPLKAEGGLADYAMPQGLPTTFVPGRNVLFLTMAAAYAVKVGAKDIVTGVCQTDYSGYPDCRRSFVDALEKALTEGMPSSAGPIRILTPLMHLTKAETVHLARRLGPDCWAALRQTVTCYQGLRPGCGLCPACELRAKGFAEAGFEDPATA